MVTLIAVNGITLARKRGRHSVFLCSLESHSTLKCSDLFVILSHWKDFLNNQDLSRQLCGENRRKDTYLGLAVNDDCCCQGKEPKFLQVIGNKRERGVQGNKCFAPAALLKMGEYQLPLNIGIEQKAL